MTAWLALPAGEVIVDPGASQDLIGLPAFERLKGKLAALGLRPVILKETPSSASGIGGKARPLFSALTPCSLGGFPGVVKLTVLEEDIPNLLSIGLLEMAKSVIDTESNVIHFKAFGSSAPLKRMMPATGCLTFVPGKGVRFQFRTSWQRNLTSLQEPST